METAIVKSFADGRYRFWLPMPRVIAAEREMGGKSIFALFYDLGQSLGTGGGVTVLAGATEAHLKECHAIIRNALVGGNDGQIGEQHTTVGDDLARDLVETYCYPARPAVHDLALTWDILSAAIYGIDLSETGGSKKKAAADSE